jgi:hypothetical protein
MGRAANARPRAGSLALMLVLMLVLMSNEEREAAMKKPGVAFRRQANVMRN